MLPSLFAPAEKAQTWSVWRAASCGAVLGAVAAAFKSFGPLHTAGSAGMPVWEIAAAVCGFALLCASAALLRNVIARRLIWPKLR